MLPTAAHHILDDMREAPDSDERRDDDTSAPGVRGSAGSDSGSGEPVGPSGFGRPARAVQPWGPSRSHRFGGPPGLGRILSGDSRPGVLGSHGGIAGGVTAPGSARRQDPTGRRGRPGRPPAGWLVPLLLVLLVVLAASAVLWFLLAT